MPRPPANSDPPGAVWQTAQSPSAASSAPRLIKPASKLVADGGVIGAIADCHPEIATRPAASTTTPQNTPTDLANLLAHMFLAHMGRPQKSPGILPTVGKR